MHNRRERYIGVFIQLSSLANEIQVTSSKAQVGRELADNSNLALPLRRFRWLRGPETVDAPVIATIGRLEVYG